MFILFCFILPVSRFEFAADRPFNYVSDLATDQSAGRIGVGTSVKVRSDVHLFLSAILDFWPIPISVCHNYVDPYTTYSTAITHLRCNNM